MSMARVAIFWVAHFCIYRLFKSVDEAHRAYRHSHALAHRLCRLVGLGCGLTSAIDPSGDWLILWLIEDSLQQV